MASLIMHIDMDAFFAAIEQRDNPELRGKPVIVGALPNSKRGVVSTCSYEARKYGVHSAMPISQAYKKCPNGIYLRGSHSLYSSVSRQVMSALETISPVIEQVSVDEAYIDISGLQRLWGKPEEIGKKAKALIFEATQLNSSVGIGPNRMIAKIASDYEKPDGLTVVKENEILDFLAPMDISRMRGVGKVLCKKLRSHGINKITELRIWPQKELANIFGDNCANHLYRQSRGIASDVVGLRGERKSISKETTFGDDVTDQEYLRATMRWQAQDVGRTARRHKLEALSIHIKIRLEGFETHTRSKKFKSPTNLSDDIFKAGWKLYQSSKFVGKPVRLIGVGISDWQNKTQIDMFSETSNKNKEIDNLKDQILDRFGKNSLLLSNRKSSHKK